LTEWTAPINSGTATIIAEFSSVINLSDRIKDGSENPQKDVSRLHFQERSAIAPNMPIATSKSDGK
jgi:hypothetical protein